MLETSQILSVYSSARDEIYRSRIIALERARLAPYGASNKSRDY